MLVPVCTVQYVIPTYERILSFSYYVDDIICKIQYGGIDGPGRSVC